MSPSARCLFLLVPLALAACADDADGTAAPACADDATSRGIPLGGRCVRLTAARARSGGAWKPLALTDVKVTRVDDGAVALDASAPAPVEAFELTLSAPPAEAMLQEGYQSWSFSGAVRIPSTALLHVDGGLSAGVASTGDVLDEVLGISYGATLVGDPGGAGVALAATSSEHASTAFGAARTSGATTLTVLHGPTREQLPAADGVVQMATIVVTADASAARALDRLGVELAARRPAGARAPKRPVGGWYSWNQLFDAVDAKAVDEHAALVAEKLAPKGLPLVEIDDGWEVAWGDWQANAKFPKGMKATADTIRGAGLSAGIWLAPFLVDVDASPAKADPSLFVRDANGTPLQHQPSGSKKHYFVLDGTNPASMELVGKPIAALRDAGFTFFKLDFLYAGALPGQRSKPVTGHAALAEGLRALRVAMGEDATFDACGAPIFPLLGHADALRIGTDTAFAGVSLNWATVAFAGRSTAARSFLSPLVWLDGDQTQVRAPYTMEEARASAVVAALSGPAYALGDDLRTLPADRLAVALDPDVLALAQGARAAAPVDPLESPVDKIVTSPIFDALANGGGTSAPPPSTWSATDAAGAKRTITFRWGEDRGVSVGP